ncbi:MAG TPA: glycoside hydrolase family 15 protein [Verrucomicrobiae bacterium]|nr:glycoside hydrolase family 15 protein [Verrucomicrobiae bacterium]
MESAQFNAPIDPLLKAPAPVVPYAPLNKHGLVGDRRTAALIAADGTLDWLCLPDYDGAIGFGALLDWAKGGYWRLGSSNRVLGEQRYIPETFVLETRWSLPQGELVLRDAMLWPETKRAPEQAHVRAIVRSLRCIEGSVRCRFDLQTAHNFEPPQSGFSQHSSGFSIQLPELSIRVWASVPLEPDLSRLHGEIELHKDQELWTVLDAGATGHGWSIESARNALDQTARYWRDWLERFHSPTGDAGNLKRTAMIVHLLTHSPGGAVIAAPTTSVPERLGGDWNADYRFSWVRDASLALGILAKLGAWEDTERYLQWIVERQSRFGHPLQVLYTVRGEKRPKQRELKQVAGYRASKPVRIGNHAYKQQQFGSLAFLADCSWVFLNERGPWREEYWRLIRRCADYVVKHWTQPDNGIWELAEPQHFVHSKVLCWVTLDRAIRIAEKLHSAYDLSAWQAERSRIREDIMQKGWNEQVGAFCQRYGAQNLDAAELLISVMDFLPGDHPRVLSTIDRIAEHLTINGLVYRFDPMSTPGVKSVALGEMEGAFLPCTFWLACAYAKAGRIEKAKAILDSVERLTAGTGLFPEAVDARTGLFLGNTPLLFSHAEFVRAKLQIAIAKEAKDESLLNAA